ncbi:hypothetical protein Javan350_0020 [Streptococcus phage Javan350]|nr:hypothetical protein Javan350_0020 [Streptococcus phage Javan350]
MFVYCISCFNLITKNPALVPHGSKAQELANSLYAIRPSLTHILARF